MTLKALSDPSRRRQLERLARGAATSGQLAELLTMSRPAGSQHLSVLVDATLAHTLPAGRQRWHTLAPEPLYRAKAWLDQLLAQWEEVGARAAAGAVSVEGESIEGASVARPIRSLS